MITYITGDLFKSKAQVLVNTVNCVGVMGKGLAAQFKQKYPLMFSLYRQRCQQGLVKIGHMDVYPGEPFIINFPTKQDWRNPSQIEWIKEGLQDLQRVIREYQITSIAIPPLGCGLGGLNKNIVRSWIEHYLIDSSTQIMVYNIE